MSFPTWCFHYWSDLNDTSYACTFNNGLLHTIVVYFLISNSVCIFRVFLNLGLRKNRGLPLRVFRPGAFIIDPILIKLRMHVHLTRAYCIQFSFFLKLKFGMNFSRFLESWTWKKLRTTAKSFPIWWFYYWPRKRLDIPYQKPFG